MQRVADPALFLEPVIVTSADHQYVATRQLQEVGASGTIVLEPLRRDSGPAILAACTLIARNNAATPALILAADHVVKDPVSFIAAVQRGLTAARMGLLVTFGILPTHAETGYGYIEPGDPIAGGARNVRRFTEKPSAEIAARYVANGCLWNSGNFLASVGCLISEYTRFSPTTVAAVKDAIDLAKRCQAGFILNEAAFSRAESRSIDYAVFERTDRAAVVDVDCGWSDIGTWAAMWDMREHDQCGNSLSGDIEAFDTHNCLVSTDRTLTSLIGVRDLVVVANRDAILVADRRRSADVKLVVETLREKGRSEADSHPRKFRPWGWYEVIDAGEQYQIKRIVVNPKGQLSPQKHKHRSQHWIVVSGVAKVTVDDCVGLVGRNEHAYIPLGSVHRLENPNDIPVEIIEVQNGSHLGEDVRLEDAYAPA